MKTATSWTRTLALALLCALAFVPGALHARVCLVELGAIEKSDCCSIRTCCDEEPSNAPALRAGEQNCRCCLDLDVDTAEKTLPASLLSTGAHSFAAPARFCESLPAILPPPASARALLVFARAGPRPRLAAPVPLRI